ncbi:YceD family protein [Methylomicrobium sp. Wu6]|uniref:YceD family protein n=1 Tax=Methylomicrobium sp. Wu6 TaxID=3107928 RepID=UPI002DD68C7D|nr:YceD family protein [Methylomicrobium sp. Wu6]MEC4747805.1 YceD family protein [Methylomicrobium sp. Wu6]
MLARLPKYIDPLHLADKRSELKGELSLKDFGRLGDMLSDTTGNVVIDLFFSREGRLVKIEGKIETHLQLVCQNCLKALDWPVQAEVHLGIVNSLEQVDRLPPDFEPLFIEEEKILLQNIIEDELLLNLPQYPKHPEPCKIEDTGSRTPGQAEADRQKKQDNPFSILTHLKNLESPHGSTKK